MPVIDVSALAFNRLIGLERGEPGSELLVSLPAGEQYTNHVGTVHASALLAVAEAGSGEFIVRSMGHLEGLIPVVRSIEAKFRKPATGRVSARCLVPQDTVEEWIVQVSTRGRCLAPVAIEVIDGNAVVVLTAVIDWFISSR